MVDLLPGRHLRPCQGKVHRIAVCCHPSISVCHTITLECRIHAVMHLYSLIRHEHGNTSSRRVSSHGSMCVRSMAMWLHCRVSCMHPHVLGRRQYRECDEVQYVVARFTFQGESVALHRTLQLIAIRLCVLSSHVYTYTCTPHNPSFYTATSIGPSQAIHLSLSCYISRSIPIYVYVCIYTYIYIHVCPPGR